MTDTSQVLEQLSRLAHRLSQSRTLDDVAQVSFETIHSISDTSSKVLLFIVHTAQPASWYTTPNATTLPHKCTNLLQQGIIADALRFGRPQSVSDTTDSEQQVLGKTLLVVPLLDGAQSIGALIVAHPYANAFSDDTMRAIIAMASTIALSVRQFQLVSLSQEVETTRDRMINLLVHDIRSPLMAVYASIEVVRRALRGSEPNPFIQDALETGLRTVRTVVDLTSDMLDLRRLHAGQQMFDPESIVVEDLFSEVRSTLLPLGTQRQIAINILVEPAQLAIHVDQRLMRRTMMNLVANAIRFTAPNTDVTMTAHPSDDGGILLTVEDRGPGVPMNDRERIFLAFVQGDGESSRGSGLGLALCREVVLAHNGRIWVDDRAGGGSRFCVWLPDQG